MRAFLIANVLCIAACGIVDAGSKEAQRTLTKVRVERIEKDLINAFRSDIPGLQTSAATTLLQVRKEVPEYSWSKCIIPLLRVVNDENSNPDARIAAALVLYELKSSHGNFSIVQNARFSSNARVKRFCSMLAAYHRLD